MPRHYNGRGANSVPAPALAWHTAYTCSTSQTAARSPWRHPDSTAQSSCTRRRRTGRRCRSRIPRASAAPPRAHCTRPQGRNGDAAPVERDDLLCPPGRCPEMYQQLLLGAGDKHHLLLTDGLHPTVRSLEIDGRVVLLGRVERNTGYLCRNGEESQRVPDFLAFFIRVRRSQQRLLDSRVQRLPGRPDGLNVENQPLHVRPGSRIGPAATSYRYAPCCARSRRRRRPETPVRRPAPLPSL